MTEVTLLEMLDARERRTERQQDLLQKFGSTLICFTMNIAGPVKISDAIIRAFREGCSKIRYRILEDRIIYQELLEEKTGCEAYFVVNDNAIKVKEICASIEDETELGRLFDIDVIDSRGEKLDRSCVNGKRRDCIVCGAAGRGCASRRLHTVAELQFTTNQIINNHFAKMDSEQIGGFAVQSLLEEVRTTPKPGLVDCNDSGSHKDMDLHTFIASATALKPYFVKCVKIGQETSGEPVDTVFKLLQKEGIRAEECMYNATKGINTHKGAIYIFGILCGAIGRCWTAEEPISDLEKILQSLKEIAEYAIEKTYQRLEYDHEVTTTGEQLLLHKGIKGVRGEVAEGLPSVIKIGVPVYRECIRNGLDHNYAGCITLLHLIKNVSDTNLYKRGGEEGVRYVVKEVERLLEASERPTLDEISLLNEKFVQRNLSPGGCADLLAVTYFVNKLI